MITSTIRLTNNSIIIKCLYIKATFTSTVLFSLAFISFILFILVLLPLKQPVKVEPIKITTNNGNNIILEY